ncbi:MAG TPA: lanthionine synthetase LanC family protein [Kofleriaceae bacterium]|nr:lanthionine synthetase LanC family protein [Kofleriaceae bacterium]
MSVLEARTLTLNALPAISARHLGDFVGGYLDEVTALSYVDVKRSQPRPHASIACGAAGIAYALWRVSRRLDRPELLAHAARWAREASAARGERSAFAGTNLLAAERRGSVVYGPAGVDLVLALVGAPRAAAASRARFRRAAATGLAAELYFGAAGELAAAEVLRAHRRATAADVRRAAARLDEERLEAEWSADRTLGMAHGIAGMCFALLQASRRPPAWLLASLDRLAALGAPLGRGTRWPHDTAGAPSRMPPSWCNGSAGMAFLWARAHEATGQARHRQLARRAALDVYDHASSRPDLCCGAVGQAYAMLALARIDPGGGWRRKARQLTTLALVSDVELEAPHGLLTGEPGLLCLAVDLMTGETRFPLFEA